MIATIDVIYDHASSCYIATSKDIDGFIVEAKDREDLTDEIICSISSLDKEKKIKGYVYEN